MSALSGTLVGAAVLVAAAIIVVSLRTVPRALEDVHPTRVRVTELERTRARQQLPGLTPVELRTRDGLRLKGWFSPGANRSAVVLIHGLFSNRAQLLPEAAVLARHGHGVLMFDSRASGDSDGSVATWGDKERLDVLAALDFLSGRPDVDPGRIGAYGFSVGATPVALAGASDRRLRAIALGPIWPSLREEIANKFRKRGLRSAALARLVFRTVGVDLDAVRPIDVMGQLAPRPLMLLSGSEDVDTPPAVMAQVFARTQGAERWLVVGAGHGGYAQVDPDGLDQRFGGFFDRALPSSGATSIQDIGKPFRTTEGAPLTHQEKSR